MKITVLLEQKAQLSKTCNIQNNSKLNSSRVFYKKEITSIGVEVIEMLCSIKNQRQPADR